MSYKNTPTAHYYKHYILPIQVIFRAQYKVHKYLIDIFPQWGGHSHPLTLKCAVKTGLIGDPEWYKVRSAMPGPPRAY